MSSSSWLAESGLGDGSNNQKVKSLGVLCTKFVSLYNREDVELVELDDAAKRLGVERRRIYDIVNVLESIGGLKRRKKNQFSWIGFSGIEKALGELKESLDIGDDSADQNEDLGQEKRNQTLATSCTNSPLKNRPALDHRKETSLGLLTQKFDKLFLNRKADTISLDEAAVELLGNDHDSSIKTNNNATKVRRLSDIANVLSSLNLIEKTHKADTKKLAFRWLGLKEELDKGVSVAIPQESREIVAIPPIGRQRNKRTFVTDLTNLDFKRIKSSTPDDRKTISENVEVTKSDENAEANAKGKIHDWEMLAPSFRPQYQNREPGLGDGSNNQKVKSLGVLCTKFVALYNRKDAESVELDDAAKRLGVERRRIYDIVNVLTSIGGLKMCKKNQFSWIGFSGIAKTLGDIKESLRIGDDSVDQNEDFGEEKRNQTLATSCTNSPLKNRPALDHRKVTSLGLLTQKFVKLFLNTKADTISLDDAIIELLGNDQDLSSKTNNNAAKVRRLSDIANVLSSLNLIEKTRQADTRKMAFRWLGLKEELDKGVSVAIPQEGRETVAIPPTGTHRNKRTFGTGLTNMDFKRTKSSTPEDRKTIIENAEVTKSDENAEANAEGKIHDWEMLAPSFRPKYQNRVLLDLFSHYKEAWNSWHVEAIHGSNRMKQPWFCSTLATLDSGHGGLMSFVSLCAHSTPLLNIYLAQVDNILPKWIVMLRNTFSLSFLSLSN